MKSQMLTIGLIAGLLFLITPSHSQEFYGANFTGKHTWGVNVKYNGDFWVGTHYNNRRFGGFGKGNLDFNLVTEVKIEKGKPAVAAELGFNQVYADGNDFQASFGLGARYAIRAEYHPILYKDEVKLPENPCGQTRLSLNVGFAPGYYANDYSIAAKVEVTPVKFIFGCEDVTYEEPKAEGKKMDFRYFDEYYAGMRSDYTNSTKGSGRFHITADAGNFFFTKRKFNAAWDTYYNLNDHLPIKGDYEGVEDEPAIIDENASCQDEFRNFNIGVSAALRF